MRTSQDVTPSGSLHSGSPHTVFGFIAAVSLLLSLLKSPSPLHVHRSMLVLIEKAIVGESWMARVLGRSDGR